MPNDRTLLIADDHEVFRIGLAQVARRKLKFSSVLEAATFGEALERLGDERITVAICDVAMPGLARPAELARIRRARPDVCLIVLSGSSAREDILEALAAGVHGYIVKSARTDDLVATIRTVMSGTIYVPPSLAELPPLREEPAARPAADEARSESALSGLTDRQREVLRLIADGLSNKEIAQRMRIAEGTVKMHVTAILRATSSRNRAQAAALGKRLRG
jgi:RNA polymerase sigma factor (sigma-70 family)